MAVGQKPGRAAFNRNPSSTRRVEPRVETGVAANGCCSGLAVFNGANLLERLPKFNCVRNPFYFFHCFASVTPMQAKAAIADGKGQFTLEEIEVASPKAGEGSWNSKR